MTTTSHQADANAVRKSITIAAPREVAFRVFTEKMTTWWPLETHHIGKAAAKEAIVEPRVGGRWFERGVDGTECTWGHVLAWEPPGRLVLSWEISSEWQHDEKLLTEVEVRFIADGTKSTRVELEHRNLDGFGQKRDEMRATLDSAGGWTGLLEGFAKAVA